MTITDEYLAELERLDKAAVPPPWKATVNDDYPDRCDGINQVIEHNHPVVPYYSPDNYSYDCPACRADEIITTDSGYYGPDMKTAEFLCAARNAFPELVAEVRRLRKELAEGPYQHCTKYQEGQCGMYEENERLRSTQCTNRADHPCPNVAELQRENERLRAVLKNLLRDEKLDDDDKQLQQTRIEAESALAGEQLSQPEVDRLMARLAEGKK